MASKGTNIPSTSEGVKVIFIIIRRLYNQLVDAVTLSKYFILLGINGLLTVSFALEKPGAINGFVRDKRNGEALSYVHIKLINTKYRALSNKKGYYVISNVPPGEYTLQFSLIGYIKVEKKIVVKSGETTTLDINMQESSILLKPVTISGKRARFEREVDVSLRHIDVKEIRRTPAFVEKDLFRTLQLLPGIVAVSDFSSALYIRGGRPDENLVLLDGVTVYNPYHIGGLFSSFNIDAIKSVDLYTGGFPAQYGNRISSVLDIETKAGNSKKFSCQGETSFLSSKIVLEGPLRKGSWMVSGRRTYFDAIIGILKSIGIIEESFPYYFYDLHGKVNFNLSHKSRITLSGFFGDDILYPEELLFRWGNYTFSSKWRYLFTPKLFSTFIFTKTRYRAELKLKEQNVTKSDDYNLYDGIGSIGVKGDISYFFTDNYSWIFGFEAREFELISKWIVYGHTSLEHKKVSKQGSFYLQNKYRVPKRWVTNIGLRLDYWSKGDEYKFSPRIGVKYFLHPDFALKGAWGHYYQFLTIPSLKGGELFERLPSAVFQFWYPMGGKFEPIYAEHYIVGIEKWFSEYTNLTIEGYYKNMHNLLEVSVEDLLIEKEETQKFTVGKGYAWGIEGILKIKNYWISYTYGITKRKMEDTWFFPIHDRRHSININLGFPFQEKWRFDIVWVYGSGLPYTGKVGRYQYVNFDPFGQYTWIAWREITGKRGGIRYPSYHRMDVGISREFKFRTINCSSYLQVINVYNRKNIFFCYWDYDSISGRPTLIGISMIPFFPSIGIRFNF